MAWKSYDLLLTQQCLQIQLDQDDAPLQADLLLQLSVVLSSPNQSTDLQSRPQAMQLYWQKMLVLLDPDDG